MKKLILITAFSLLSGVTLSGLKKDVADEKNDMLSIKNVQQNFLLATAD